jgi:hypothetical protein
MFAQVGDRRSETPKIILNIEGNPKISNQSTGNVFGDWGQYRQGQMAFLLHPVAANFFRRPFFRGCWIVFYE